MTIRTRFAPSPTGYLHIGGARTALYAWLFAKQQQGTFILRIEDTDRERSTPESIQAILEAMDWLKLDYQEGPFYQTQCFDRYAEVIQQLIATGKAYRCYCSKERLDALRETQQANKEKPRYDGHCRHLTEQLTDQPFVIRFCNPKDGEVVFEDAIKGEIRFSNSELDDLIIARTDGVPTYNLTVVVDDWDMKISHVIRGDDHVNNTPRQINIFKALDANPPIYAHVPMILGEDGKRLSKRHGAVSVMQYREDGFLPHTLLNYLARLGWSHGDQEIFSRDELISLFKLSSINRSPAALNTQKLLWLNQHYLKNAPREEIMPELIWHMQRANIDVTNGPTLIDIINVQAERCKTLCEMVEKSRFFYEEVEAYDPTAAQKNLMSETLPVFRYLVEKFEALGNWEKEALHEIIKEAAAALDVGMGKIAQPLRVALTGNTVSPPIDETLALLGKEKTLERVKQALVFIDS
ncbi:MAG: gltX 1 [Gammaproteobacteria bacterium]|jgi:glutamyl-tRNA synthetase|nr:gltX 1 [Gammaproteobacteria bacterium]